MATLLALQPASIATTSSILTIIFHFIFLSSFGRVCLLTLESEFISHWLHKNKKKGRCGHRHLHYLEQTAQRQKQIIEILQRAQCAPTAPLHQRYEAIKQLSKDYKVHILCEALQVAKGSYYNHLLRNNNGATTAAKRHSEMQPIIFLHEKFTMPKVIGVMMIVFGLVLTVL